MYRIPLAYSSFGDQEREALLSTFDSGYCTQGAQVAAFEKEFAAYCGRKHCIKVNSGSSANLVALTALALANGEAIGGPNSKIQKGDEFVIQALCWPTTIYPLTHFGMKPVFCDVDPGSMNMTCAELDKVVTDKTRVVIATPVLGNPTGLAELRKYCDEREIFLVEDACESLGAKHSSGRMVGSFGDLSCFSLFFSHHITTVEGGCIVTDDDQLAAICRSVRSHGWSRDLSSDLYDESTLHPDIDQSFRFILPGYNVRSNDLFAAIGRVQLSKLEPSLARRRQIAKGRIEVMSAHDQKCLVPGADIMDEHSWMAFPVLFRTREQRIQFRELIDQNGEGIESRMVIVGNLLRQPIAEFFELSEEQIEMPVSDNILECGLMIGLNPNITDAEEAFVLDVFNDALTRLS